MKDEKDRLGNKLHDVEAAREDQWAAEQDAKLLRRMREKREKSVQCTGLPTRPRATSVG